MLPAFSSVMFILAMTRVTTLPNLPATYCNAGAVVIASLDHIEPSDHSSEPAYLEIRVTDVLRGPLRVGDCLRVAGRSGISLGGHYLFFLTNSPVFQSVSTGASRIFMCRGRDRTTLLPDSLSVTISVSPQAFTFPAGYLVFPETLLAAEEDLRLRAAKEPIVIPQAALRLYLKSLDSSECNRP